MEALEGIRDHFQTYMNIYIIVWICAIPFLIVFRRWIGPGFRWLIEIVVYMALVHGAVWLIVKVARWYKHAATMEALSDGSKPPPPPWGIPIVRFWDRNLYDPTWLFYLELALLLGIVFLVFRYRPMKAQKAKPKAAPAKKSPPKSYERFKKETKKGFRK